MWCAMCLARVGGMDNSVSWESVRNFVPTSMFHWFGGEHMSRYIADWPFVLSS